MSPNNIKVKANKYFDLFAPLYRASHLSGMKGVTVHIKHSTLRDLINFMGELADRKDKGE